MENERNESLSVDDLTELAARLINRRKVLIRVKSSLQRQELHELSPSETGEAKCPIHPADLASDVAGEEMLNTLVTADIREIQNIERALGKLRHNAYGICEDCDERIPIARLLVVPETRFCYDCEQTQELLRRRRASANWEEGLRLDPREGMRPD